MKLYYTPGACSLAPHIVIREIDKTVDLEKVDLASGTTESGVNFNSINPHGYVPVLQLDNGETLREGVAILQYLADQQGGEHLAPANGTLERSRLQAWLNFLVSEFHKYFAPLFHDSSDEQKKQAIEIIEQRLDYFASELDGREYLHGETFSIADAYLFVLLSWTGPTGIGLDRWPALRDYTARIAARDAVQAAMKAEGLIG